MSNKERAVAMLDDFSEVQLGNVIVMLQAMKQTINDAVYDEEPNAETIAALLEGDEMLRTGSGESWTGSTEELFRRILEEEDE